MNRTLTADLYRAVLCIACAFLLSGCGKDPESLASECRLEAIKTGVAGDHNNYVKLCMGAKGYELENVCWSDYNTLSPQSGKIPDYCFEKRNSIKQFFRNLKN